MNLAAVGFEPTRTNTGHLKCLPLDQLGQTACDSFLRDLSTHVAAVGFEPTRTNTAGLKSAPLDQLGQTAVSALHFFL